MLNNVVLMGRLTAAPEMKITPSGTSVLRFTLAVDRRFQQKDGEKQTDFINCVAWRNTAEFISKYFDKGEMIVVTGEIQTRKYEVDGQNRVATEVIVNNASFCGGKTKKDTDSNDNINDGFMPIADYGDLPFPL